MVPENWKKQSPLEQFNANKFQFTADVKLNKKCCFLNHVISIKINNIKKKTSTMERQKIITH